MEHTESSERRQLILNMLSYLTEKSNGNNITKRALVVGRLEDLSGMVFKTTKQFNESHDKILYKVALAQKLEEDRIDQGMTIEELASHIRLPVEWLKQMERASRNLNKKALKFIGEPSEEE